MIREYETKSDSELVALLNTAIEGTALKETSLIQEIEMRLEQRTASLAEIDFLTKKLLEMNERFKESEKVQSGFLSLIKNEFNNPMSVLLLLSKRLSKNIEDTQASKKMVKIMRTDLLRMDFQLKNIFAITEIEAGEISNALANVNIETIVDDCKEALEPIMEDKGISIVFENGINTTIVSDSSKLYQIVVNLLSNAVEFSFPNKTVQIKSAVQDDKVRIEVHNFGEGMTKVNKKEIYNRFTRFEIGSARESTGLGLGLSVVKSFVETLDGTIDYECDEGTVTFWVELPVKDTTKNSVADDDVFFDAFDDESVSF